MSNVTDEVLEYYVLQSPITAPSGYAELFEDLPSGVGTLCGVVQGIIMHHCLAAARGIELGEERRQEVELRHVPRMLARILELDERPLTAVRSPEKRLSINCRDYSVMLCAMLRHQGVPARARAGFAGYFGACPEGEPGFYVDHWVCEYWNADEGRWALVDVEIDEFERELCKITMNPLDVPRDQFLVAGKAWQLCREERADPDRFGLDPDPESEMHGLWYVQSQLVRDLAAMNKMELLCWDCWAMGDVGPKDKVSEEDLSLLDRVAALTQADNSTFAELRFTHENDARLRVPPVINSYTRAGVRKVQLPSLE